MEFRTLKENEIDIKVGTVNSKGVTFLLYKNARVDMAILDETVGAENWQRDHKEVKGNLYCGVGIWSEEKKQWIWKWDCGVESAYGDKEKSEASDSFKRACVNATGVGRELYTAPLIFVECETEKTDMGYKIKNAEDKKRFYGMKVAHIEYNNKREITDLVIVDGQGCQVYPKAFNRTEKVSDKIDVEKTYSCDKCGEGVTQKVADYSFSKYKKILCFDCQKKEA